MSLIIQSRHALKRRFGATAMQTWNFATKVSSGHSCRTPSAFRSMTSSADNDNDNDNDNALESTGAPGTWRKKQLHKLEKKFASRFAEDFEEVEGEEDLQSDWKAMDSRVTRRRSLTKAEMGGKSGRVNVRRTDEEMWLQAGLYENVGDGDGDGDEGTKGTKS